MKEFSLYLSFISISIASTTTTPSVDLNAVTNGSQDDKMQNQNVQFCSISEIPEPKLYSVDYSLTLKGLCELVLKRNHFMDSYLYSTPREVATGLKFHDLPGNWSISVDVLRSLHVLLDYTTHSPSNIKIVGSLLIKAPWIKEVSYIRNSYYDQSSPYPSRDPYPQSYDLPTVTWRKSYSQLPTGDDLNKLSVNFDDVEALEIFHKFEQIITDHDHNNKDTNKSGDLPYADEVTFIFHIDILDDSWLPRMGDLEGNCHVLNAETTSHLDSLERAKVDRKMERERMSESAHSTGGGWNYRDNGVATQEYSFKGNQNTLI